MKQDLNTVELSGRVPMNTQELLTKKQTVILGYIMYLSEKYNTITFFKSNSQLADELGISNKTIVEGMKVLTSYGFITRIAGTRTNNQASEYTLNLDTINKGSVISDLEGSVISTDKGGVISENYTPNNILYNNINNITSNNIYNPNSFKESLDINIKENIIKEKIEYNKNIIEEKENIMNNIQEKEVETTDSMTTETEQLKTNIHQLKENIEKNIRLGDLTPNHNEKDSNSSTLSPVQHQARKREQEKQDTNVIDSFFQATTLELSEDLTPIENNYNKTSSIMETTATQTQEQKQTVLTSRPTLTEIVNKYKTKMNTLYNQCSTEPEALETFKRIFKGVETRYNEGGLNTQEWNYIKWAAWELYTKRKNELVGYYVS